MNPGCGNVPTPKDIAVGMCRITRYAGALWVPLAAHSVIVAEFCYRRAESDKDRFFCYGLLHDAHETVTGEVTRHYKPAEMKPFENELDDVIFSAFNLDVQAYREQKRFIKSSDEMSLAAEATLLGLKGWPAYYERMEGHPPLRLMPDYEALAKIILNYWSRPEMVTAGSDEQQWLEAALRAVKDGDHRSARIACLPEEVLK
jgi:hypothetical protein